MIKYGVIKQCLFSCLPPSLCSNNTQCLCTAELSSQYSEQPAVWLSQTCTFAQTTSL